MKELLRTGPVSPLLHAAARTISFIRRATGEVVFIRQGWYANPWLRIDKQHAARVGGRLACSSAAGRLGMWEPLVTSTHVCVPVNAARLRSPTSCRTALGEDVRVEAHWTGLDPAGSRTVVGAPHCIRRVAFREAPEIALAVAESALHRGVLSDLDRQAALASFPAGLRRLLDRAGRGSESVFLSRMARAGVAVRQQVRIGGIRVDGLIGDRMVVEIDSRRLHQDPAAGRARDALLSVLGYRVLRFDSFQVMDRRATVEAAVLAAIARGDHLAPDG